MTAGGPRRQQASNGKDLSKSSSLAGLAAGKQNFHMQTCACWRARAPVGAGRLKSVTAGGPRRQQASKGKDLSKSSSWAGLAAGKQNFHTQTGACWQARAPVSAGMLKSVTAGGPRRQQASNGKDLSKSSSLAGLAAGKHNFHMQTCACWRARAPVGAGRLKSVTASGPRRQQASKGKDKQNFHMRTCACWQARAPVSTGGLKSVAPASKQRQSSLAGLAAGKHNFHMQTCLAGPGASGRRKAQISNCWRAQAPASKQGQRSFQCWAGLAANKQNLHMRTCACWQARAPVSTGGLKSVPAGRPSERRKAQISNCWRAQAPSGAIRQITACGAQVGLC